MEFDKLKKAIVAAAKKLKIDEYEIYYASDSSLSVETLKQEISNFSSGVSATLSFRCLSDGKMGYSSTELLVPEEMYGLVFRAAENAKSTEKPDEVGIFAGSPEYKTTNVPGYRPYDATVLKQVALDIQRENYAYTDKIADGTQSVAMTFGLEMRLCNSHGLDLTNSAGINCVYSVIAVRDGEDSENNFEIAEYNADSFDAKALAKKAADGALESLGAGAIASGKYNVVINGKQMRSMLSVFSNAFSAKSAQQGMSLLAGKEGEKIASDIVTITDDPMREGCRFQTSFDSEGVATYRKNIVENGVLKTLLHNRETAGKAGCESTGNSARGNEIRNYAFCIEAGKYTKDELFGLAGNGIFITEVKGLHAGANSVTGDFSIESAGFVIENGKKGRPIKSFTIAGNFFDLLKAIEALSDTVEIGVPTGFTSFGAPAVFIRNMSVAGK